MWGFIWRGLLVLGDICPAFLHICVGGVVSWGGGLLIKRHVGRKRPAHCGDVLPSLTGGSLAFCLAML